MLEKGYALSQLEQDAYLQIIAGKKPPDYFDTFVKEWKNNGGQQITKEVNQKIKS